jgi:signal transduction histidine kinase
MDTPVAAALGRAALLARAAVTVTAAATGLLVLGHPGRGLALVVLVIVATGAEVGALTHRPGPVVRHRVAALGADLVVLLGVLGLSGGGLAYFTFAAGWAALAGILLGMGALPLWAALLVQEFVACTVVLRHPRPPTGLATVLLALPSAGVLAGIGGALAARAVTAHLASTVDTVAAAQRSAAAEERARLARELHDSVVKTLRGVSLAAVALPGSLRRQPALAEQLAGVVCAGADTAVREARDLIGDLRADLPDEPFAATLTRVTRAWSEQTGIPVAVSVAVGAADEPAPAERYELVQIVREALTNVERHAEARHVTVLMTAGSLVVRDDGRGFSAPVCAPVAGSGSGSGSGSRPGPARLAGPQFAGPQFAGPQFAGHGLTGIRERARLIGRALTVTSAPGGGTEVRVHPA